MKYLSELDKTLSDKANLKAHNSVVLGAFFV